MQNRLRTKHKARRAEVFDVETICASSVPSCLSALIASGRMDYPGEKVRKNIMEGYIYLEV